MHFWNQAVDFLGVTMGNDSDDSKRTVTERDSRSRAIRVTPKLNVTKEESNLLGFLDVPSKTTDLPVVVSTPLSVLTKTRVRSKSRSRARSTLERIRILPSILSPVPCTPPPPPPLPSTKSRKTTKPVSTQTVLWEPLSSGCPVFKANVLTITQAEFSELLRFFAIEPCEKKPTKKGTEDSKNVHPLSGSDIRMLEQILGRAKWEIRHRSQCTMFDALTAVVSGELGSERLNISQFLALVKPIVPRFSLFLSDATPNPSWYEVERTCWQIAKSPEILIWLSAIAAADGVETQLSSIAAWLAQCEQAVDCLRDTIFSTLMFRSLQYGNYLNEGKIDAVPGFSIASLSCFLEKKGKDGVRMVDVMRKHMSEEEQRSITELKRNIAKFNLSCSLAECRTVLEEVASRLQIERGPKANDFINEKFELIEKMSDRCRELLVLLEKCEEIERETAAYFGLSGKLSIEEALRHVKLALAGWEERVAVDKEECGNSPDKKKSKTRMSLACYRTLEKVRVKTKSDT